MKCRIIMFVITILCFAAITVAQPRFPTIAPPAGSGILNLGGVLDRVDDGGPAKGPSERELLCRDLVAFAFPESQDIRFFDPAEGVPFGGVAAPSDIFVRTFYPEKGLPHLRTRRLSRWGLSDHVSPGDQSRRFAQLDRAMRNQTIQEQSRVLYNLCKSTDNSIEVEN